jgi:glycosyltransferase involved in cell wall biosynthesis
MIDISVIYSIYGDFDISRLYLSIQSVLNQNKVNVEVIVSESGLRGRFKDFAKKLGCRYYFSYKSDSNFSPGSVRNTSLKNAKGNYVYANDADIVFLDRDYLRILLDEIEGNQVFIKPSILRLPLCQFDSFSNLSKAKGIEYAIENLTIPNDYIAYTENLKYELVVTEDHGRVFTASKQDYLKYKNWNNLAGMEPTIFFDTVHCGGIFAKLDYLKKVGGYYTGYKVWGYEDSDLQWKLEKLYSNINLSESSKLKVLHLDHEKKYFNPDFFIENQIEFDKRKKAKIKDIINSDNNDFLCKKENF